MLWYLWLQSVVWLHAFINFRASWSKVSSNGIGFGWALWNPLLVACASGLSPLVVLLHAGWKEHGGSWENPVGWDG